MGASKTSGETSLAVLSNAERMLTEATTIAKAKELKDLALTAADWAKRKKLGDEHVNHAQRFAYLASRRMGELLQATDRAKGSDKAGRKSKFDGTRKEPTNTKPTLADIGISKKESSEAQFLADLPEQEFTKEILVNKKPPAKLRKEKKKAARAQNLRSEPWPTDKFRVFYADPPWQYSNSGLSTSAAQQYDTMSTENICALDVKGIATKDAVLFMWVTSPMVPDALKIIDAWGFQYKTSFVWYKERGVRGFYGYIEHEFLFLATRGSCTPEGDIHEPSVIRIARTGKHSEKPEDFRDLIDRLYPNGPALEIFSRKEFAEGSRWRRWGNEVLVA